MKINIQIVGVGGQGILTASKILANAALADGLNVIMSEVHGMAQRGGVVESSIRIGDVYSPIIGNGKADVILSFEPMEAYRALDKANKDTKIVTNIEPMVPFTVTIGQGEYPPVGGLIEGIKKVTPHVYSFDAFALAREAGTEKAANVVMLGALSALGILPISPEKMKETVALTVPAKFRDVNMKAFEMGFEAVKKEK